MSAEAVVRELARPRLAAKKAGGLDRIDGGSDRLPVALAARLGRRIRYGTRVTRIEQWPGSVEVTVQDATGTRSITAEHVIAAVPPRVLSEIPGSGIPEERRLGLRALGSTSVVRVFFQCGRRFWRARGESGAASTDRSARWVVEDTVAQEGTRGILSTYLSGKAARLIAGREEGERVLESARDVAAVHPELDRYLERTASYCWDTDSLARGAHAAPRPGQRSLVRQLATPEGRICFAGEHLSDAPGWMEGAIASGLRAARELR